TRLDNAGNCLFGTKGGLGAVGQTKATKRNYRIKWPDRRDGIPRFEDDVYHGHMIDETAIRNRYEAMRTGLDERERRLLAAAEARTAGYGGVSAVARATGIARSTIDRGKGSPPGRWLSIAHTD